MSEKQNKVSLYHQNLYILGTFISVLVVLDIDHCSLHKLQTCNLNVQQQWGAYITAERQNLYFCDSKESPEMSFYVAHKV